MKSFLKKIQIFLCLLAIFPVLAVPAVYAQTGAGGTAAPSSGANPCVDTAKFEYVGGTCVPKSPSDKGLAGQKTLGGLVQTVITVLLTLAGVIAVVFIILGGYWYMTAQGNDEQAEKGRKALTNAIIGLVIVMLAFVIVYVVTSLVTSNKVI